MEVVAEHRGLAARDRPLRAEREALPAGRSELAVLREAIERLAAMPPPGDVVAALDRALAWLAGFADECRKRRPDRRCGNRRPVFGIPNRRTASADSGLPPRPGTRTRRSGAAPALELDEPRAGRGVDVWGVWHSPGLRCTVAS